MTREEKQKAIDAVERLNALKQFIGYDKDSEIVQETQESLDMAIKALEQQPEIIRCGQCKYAEVADPEDSQDGYTCQFHRGSIWFSGSYCSWAESEG